MRTTTSKFRPAGWTDGSEFRTYIGPTHKLWAQFGLYTLKTRAFTAATKLCSSWFHGKTNHRDRGLPLQTVVPLFNSGHNSLARLLR